MQGAGIITASIIGDGKGYASGRDYAASLGLVPKQHSRGDKQVYLGVSKRGNRYIRKMLIHGARSVLKNCLGKTALPTDRTTDLGKVSWFLLVNLANIISSKVIK